MWTEIPLKKFVVVFVDPIEPIKQSKKTCPRFIKRNRNKSKEIVTEDKYYKKKTRKNMII